jgi:chemotaxis protein MotA
MSYDRLFNLNALMLVVGGTLVATLLRCGWAELGHAAQMTVRLSFRRRFSEPRVRAALASQVRQINAEGLLRAEIGSVDDDDRGEALAAMLHRRSVEAITDYHAMQRRERECSAGDAVRVFNLAADLAPVFGLAGTLVALSQLPVGGLATEAISTAVSTAVLTTLYGVLTANLVYGPLGRQIARVAEKEEADRQMVIDWLTSQLRIPPFTNEHSQPPSPRPRLVRSRPA